MTTDRYLASEVAIVWIDDDAKRLPFVRERLHRDQPATSRPPDIGSTRVVAYAVLDESKRDPERSRRVWLSRPDDLYPDDRCPFEGVCPSSIVAGAPSRQPLEVA